MPKPPITQLTPKMEAQALLLDAWTLTAEEETLPLAQCRGRVLARDVFAQYNIPVVRASAMDGVAVNAADFAGGEQPDCTGWRPGQEYSRADTGDDFDDKYDAVVPIEQVRVLPEGGLVFASDTEIRPGLNVRPAGSQVEKGSRLCQKGTRLTALDIAAIGMGGYDAAPVRRRPRVAFVPTGSELVPVGAELARGQNFDTNSLMASLLLEEMGAEPMLRPIHRDDPAAIEATLDGLLPQADIIILNAGTSKGQEDYCGQLLKRRGHLLFSGVAAVPGRPMTAAVIGGKMVLNISGPALAAFYTLDWAVKPLICQYLGVPVPKRRTVQAELTAPIGGPPMSMCCMLRLQREGDRLLATPLNMRGQGSVGSGVLLTADAMYVTTPGQGPKAAGETIPAELLRDLP
ncbi:MAG: molybdopterin molybdotransferase MoeA [Oscillospiraceae bacterium]|nr:molybdopterin molybdotransferase MoeA [Oscillospiraceae bacterium]